MPAQIPETAPTQTIPSHNWRRSPRIRERLLKVAGLRQRGLNQTQIANRLNVSCPTVSRDLQRLDLLWRQEHTHLANAERLRSLAALREAEHLCWALIERHHRDIDRLADVAACTRNLIAIQREIRQLLATVRPPQANDYWGFPTPYVPSHIPPTPYQDNTQPLPRKPVVIASDDEDPGVIAEVARLTDDELRDFGLSDADIREIRRAGPAKQPNPIQPSQPSQPGQSSPSQSGPVEPLNPAPTPAQPPTAASSPPDP